MPFVYTNIFSVSFAYILAYANSHVKTFCEYFSNSIRIHTLSYSVYSYQHLPYHTSEKAFRPAFFVITANATTQIITDKREPVAVASPMGNSVVGKSLEVR